MHLPWQCRKNLLDNAIMLNQSQYLGTSCLENKATTATLLCFWLLGTTNITFYVLHPPLKTKKGNQVPVWLDALHVALRMHVKGGEGLQARLG